MDILVKEGKVVMCKVTSIKDYGYQCQLLENWGYNIEGELLFTEITRKKLRFKPDKLLSIGKTLPLRITDMIDDIVILSKIQIDNEEIEECQERYMKYRILDNIIHGVAYNLQKDLEELYENMIRPLIQEEKTPLDILLESIDRDFDNFYQRNDLIKDKLKEDLRTKVLQKNVKLQAHIELKCYTKDGINAIKNSLRQGINDNIHIYLDSAPNYVITYETKDQNHGRQIIKETIYKIKQKIVENGGTLMEKNIEVI